MVRNNQITRFLFLRNISEKVTPTFDRYRYDCGRCHPQICLDKNIEEGKSIVILWTSIGTKNAPKGYLETTPYITGFYKVKKIHKGRGKFNFNWPSSDPRRRKWYVEMDEECSLLLLDKPIKIDQDLHIVCGRLLT